MTDDMVMGLGSQTEAAQSESPAAVPGPGDLGAEDHTLVVTPAQRHYLDALHGAGAAGAAAEGEHDRSALADHRHQWRRGDAGL